MSGGFKTGCSGVNLGRTQAYGTFPWLMKIAENWSQDEHQAQGRVEPNVRTRHDARLWRTASHMHLEPLIGLARPFNNSRTLMWTNTFEASQNDQSIFDAVKTPERFKSCFEYVHCTSSHPHWHDQNDCVPHISDGYSALGVSSVWYFKKFVFITSQNYTIEIMLCLSTLTLVALQNTYIFISCDQGFPQKHKLSSCF